MNALRILLAAVAATVLVGCARNDDPGPLGGTWRLENAGGMTMTFRAGEAETLGMIEKVSYEVKGSDVFVSSKEGLMAGTKMRYTIVSPDVVRSGAGVMRRVR